ncbi:MAG: PAS domain S-box protein [Alphaproteobacteria bacterium]|nr:PAS domain S-box protein [Alphaproteobacteria bacterium]
MAESIAVLAPAYILVQDFVTIEKLLLQASKSPEVILLAVTDEKGRVLSMVAGHGGAAAEPIFNAPPITVPDVSTPTSKVGEDIVIAWHPITTDRVLGWVKTTATLDSVTKIRAETRGDVIIGGIVVFFVLVFILNLYLRFHLRGLNAATAFASTIATQQGKQIEVPHHTTEIASLIQALNQTSRRLASQEWEILTKTTNLEEAQRISHIGNFERDLKTNSLTWSDEIFRIMGLPPDGEAPSLETFMNCVHPDDHMMVRDTIDQAIIAKTAFTFDCRIVRPDNSERYILTQGELVFGQNGEPVAVRGTMQDNTVQKQADEALRLSEARFRGAIESLQESFALYDADDRLILFNDEFLRLHLDIQDQIKPGMTFEEMVRATINKGNIPDAVGREEDFIRERISEHLNPKQMLLRELSDGSWYLINEAKTPDGGIAVTQTDITELKNAEHALRENETRMRAIIDTVPALINLKDTNNHYLMANRRHGEFFGLDPDTLAGKTSLEISENHHKKFKN